VSASINIENEPSPEIEFAGGSGVIAQGLTDEAGNILLDETGNAIQPDT